MLVSDQINEIHRLHLIEKWSLRRIARHLHIGRHTLAKYVATPAPAAASRKRTSKLDPYKAALAELLQQDSSAAASVIAQRLQTLGYDGGITILKDYLQAVRKSAATRRAYVRMAEWGVRTIEDGSDSPSNRGNNSGVRQSPPHSRGARAPVAAATRREAGAVEPTLI